MFTQVTLSDFRDAFRAIRPDNFTWDGMEVLFDYMEQVENDTGTPIEFDVIALCCDYSEDTPESIARSYDLDLSEFDEDDDDGKRAAVREYLEENTTVCGESKLGFVYLNF